MTRRTGTVLVVVAVAGVLCGALFLMGGPGALFGGGDRGPDAASTPPEQAVGPRDGRPAGSAADASGRGAVLFGRPRAQRRGVGALAARVLRWKDRTPVADAALLLTGLGNGDERVELRTKTDVRGAAGWSDVPAGDAYALRVEAAGEPPTIVPGVEVESGRTRDLGVIYVGQRGGLSGRVVDEQGKPIAGADVRAYPGYEGLFDLLTNFMDLFTSLDKEPTPLAKAETGAKGEFAIPDLSPGPLLVRATAPGKRQAVVSLKLGPEGPAGGPPTIVLESGAAVAGVVVESSGAPIPGARVSLMSEDMNDPGSIFLGRSFATTDDHGVFRLRVAEDAKRLRAFAAAPGFPTAVSKTFAAGDESVRVVVGAGATLEVVVLEAEGGQPVPGATVVLGVSDPEGGSDMATGGALLSSTTDERGTATMSAPPGTIEMAMVSAPGHGTGMAAPKSGGGADNPFGAMQSDLPDRLEAGKTARATFRLPGGYVLKGRVLDPAGHGIAGAELKSSSIMGMGGAPVATRSDETGRYRLVGMTASSMFVAVHATGWVQREADTMSFLTTRFAGAKRADAPRPGSEVEQDFTLYPSVTVRGRVIDEKDEPVSGAQVGLADAMGLSMLLGGKDAEATTSADGSYVLYDLDPSAGGPGAFMAAMAAAGMDGAPAAPAPASKSKLTLRARADGYVVATSEPFDVEGGGTVTAPPIRLGRGAVLEGHVRDFAGGAIPGAKVEVTKSAVAGDPMQQMRDLMSGKKGDVLHAGADGGFRVETLPKGTVTLTVSADAHAAARRTVEIGDGPVPAVEIRLAPAQALAGRVVDRDGRPIAKAHVTVTGAAEASDDVYVPRMEADTKEDGTFALSPLPPGRVRVSVRAAGKKTAEAVLATGGNAGDVALEDRPPGDADRLAEVKKELADVQRQLGGAKTASDRSALQARMMELMNEQRRLESGEGSEPEFTPVDGPDK